jgi:threonine aldolase
MPVSRAISLENTQNQCGGVPLTVEYTQAVADLAHDNGLVLHLDGARIFNAATALDVNPQELTKSVDSVTFCLSKGLCAPVGSVICGSVDFIRRALRMRKMLGGGMRQAGVLAAAGIVALQEIVPRLKEDHQRARNLALGLSDIPGLLLNPEKPATNMIYLSLSSAISFDEKQLTENLKKQGILVGIAGPRQLRLVTHYWIDDQAIERTIRTFENVLSFSS